MTITEGLIAEHKVFLGLFDQIEKLLPELSTVAEVSAIARLVQGTLEGHAENETQLAYLALDHKLAETGRLDRLHMDHEELDASLLAVHKASKPAVAKKRLQVALLAMRRHFRLEEKSIFPLIDQTLNSDTLHELGNVWLRKKQSVAV